ncbi:MAG: DUF3325 domain-containing protein [Rhodocyclaceae bacterium]
MMALILVALASIVAGMACLAAGMARHDAIVGKPQPGLAALWYWRIAGWSLLPLALFPCIEGWGGPIGIVLWIGLLSAGVLAVSGVIAARRRGRRAE